MVWQERWWRARWCTTTVLDTCGVPETLLGRREVVELGDVFVVEYDPTYNKLSWDSGGVPFERISERIPETVAGTQSSSTTT